MCCECLSNAYHDNKTETINYVIRTQTPYPERGKNETLCTRVCLCACAPFRCLEALSMITYGLVTCPLPCLVCEIDTKHSGSDVEIECCCPTCICLPTPCHYKDTIYPPDADHFLQKEGCQVGTSCGNSRPIFPGETFSAKSHTPGGLCVTGGIGKIITVACDIMCCPILPITWACS